MAEPTLFLDGALELVIAAVLAIVARTLWLRPMPSEAARANRLFATWWAALSGVTAVFGGMRLLAGADILTLSLYLTSLYVSIFVVCVAMGALLALRKASRTGATVPENGLLPPAATMHQGQHAIGRHAQRPWKGKVPDCGLLVPDK